MSGPRRVPVFLEHWQIECCGTPPAIGDRVDWSLVFDGPEPGTARDPVGETELDAVAVPVPIDPGDGAEPITLTRLDAGGLHAHWRTPDGRTGPVRLSGQLIMDRHGEVPYELPRTVGTVARVRIVTRHYVETEPRMYRTGPGQPRYRDVGRSPKFFAYPDPVPAGSWWKEDGVVVDLVVDDPQATGGT